MTKKVGSCFPDYTLSQKGYGRISIAQAYSGASLPWGLYVANKYKVGSTFKVKVKVKGKILDGKTQNYEPHGHISAAVAQLNKGETMEVYGNVYHGKDEIYFDAKCHIS